jgi:hypothetical protein
MAARWVDGDIFYPEKEWIVTGITIVGSFSPLFARPSTKLIRSYVPSEDEQNRMLTCADEELGHLGRSPNLYTRGKN